MDVGTLIIFDYSGTLSTQAPLFAESGHLKGQLDACGLAALGIKDQNIFWNEIVNPSWEEGSTTAVGYTPLMTARIREWQIKNLGCAAPDEVISEAAGRFVNRYLAYSIIDPSWEHLLRWLSNSQDSLTVIATDHYSEATDAVLSHLRIMRIEANALRDSRLQNGPGRFFVANSADMGVHKSDPAFWEAVKARLSLRIICDILLIDDFGINEQAGDAYRSPAQVALRRQRTVDVLRNVFQAPVKAIVFSSEDTEPSGPDHDFATLIERTSAKVREYLKASHELHQCPSHQ